MATINPSRWFLDSGPPRYWQTVSIELGGGSSLVRPVAWRSRGRLRRSRSRLSGCGGSACCWATPRAIRRIHGLRDSVSSGIRYRTCRWVERSERERNPFIAASQPGGPAMPGGTARCPGSARAACESDRLRAALSADGSSKHRRSWPVHVRLTRVGACGPGRPTTCQY
jgi:hypothetical protein